MGYPLLVTTAFRTPPERPFPFAGTNRLQTQRQSLSLTHPRTIFVGASRIAKQGCYTLEVTLDFGGDGTAMASRAAAKPKILAARKAPPQKNAPSKKSLGTSNTPRNRQGFPPQLAFHGNRLQFEMPAPQERSRSDEFPRRQVLGREVALVNRIEFLEE